MNKTLAFEKSSVEFIEKELDMLFHCCTKAAKAYSVMVSKDLKAHNKKNFEEMVLSPKEIEEHISDIIYKLNLDIEKHMKCMEPSFVAKDSVNKLNCTLEIKDTIDNFIMTKKINAICEKMIDSAISNIFKRICPSKTLNFALKKCKLGERLVSSNGYKAEEEIRQQMTFSQIEGYLINVKTELRNELLRKVLNFFYYDIENEYYSDVKLHIIA